MKLRDRSSTAAIAAAVAVLAFVVPSGLRAETSSAGTWACQRSPFHQQVADQTEKLSASSAKIRAGAAEALGYLRAYSTAGALVKALRDSSSLVRREAAMSLAWCGGRAEVEPLLAALDDDDWVVRQATWVSLTNLTGMAWPFDALADPGIRDEQVAAWRRWWADAPQDRPPSEVLALVTDDHLEQQLQGVRAIGALGGAGAADAVTEVFELLRGKRYEDLSPLQRHVGQSCIRSLGRLRDPRSLSLLIELLQSAGWARYAADALGDFGSSAAVRPLIEAYPKFSRDLNQRTRNPRVCPEDDRYSGDNTQDRMHETPYQIALALTRLPLSDPQDRAALRGIALFLLANLPSDWDGGMLYEPEAFEHVTAYLLEQAGTRRVAVEAAFEASKDSDNWMRAKTEMQIPDETKLAAALPVLARKMRGDVPYVAAWLPALCRDRSDIPRLIALIEHDNGWIAINAIKALMFLDAKEAVTPIGRLLATSHPEAEYGYSGVLEHAEYDDPTPRRREAYIRALGRLGAKRSDRLLIQILQDQRNVVEVQHAAVRALDELDTPTAIAALKRADREHAFHSVQMVAREATWRRGWNRRSRRDVYRPRVSPNGSRSRETSGKSPTRPNSHEFGYGRKRANLAAGSKKIPEPTVQAAGRPAVVTPPTNQETQPSSPDSIVFIKGDNDIGSDFNGQAGVDPWRQTYSITNSGPTYRRGRNLYVLKPARPDGKVTQLTHFANGFVADCEVSWDGKRILFARRVNGDDRNYRDVPYDEPELKNRGEPSIGDEDPWWHIWEIRIDGTGLRQITHGPYHDVQPAYLPDGRIVCSSSRIGLRDEYHGYPSTGLTVMNADGTDIHPIGFNLGGDREPAVLGDGRIVFSRLDNFYSRLKTEITIQTAQPDGTRNFAIYGPERRSFWIDVHRKNAAWTMCAGYGGTTDNRNRVLRVTQPQPFGDGRVVFTSSGGLAIAGPGRHRETKIPHDRKWAVTSPFPIDSRYVFCAATVKQFKIGDRIVTAGSDEFEQLRKGPELFRQAVNIDLGVYLMDATTGEMSLVHNDPSTADFEARPIRPRPRPPVLVDNPITRSGVYSATLFCNSARISRESRTKSRGSLVRVVEGMPVVSRHATQNNRPTNRWKNHGGTHARILGTVPLASDGSFCVEVPADRLLHLQVLDSDRRVVNNQLFWLYARPGEQRSCAGCHERPDEATSPLRNLYPLAAAVKPVKCLPNGDEFTYRAKAWLKGVLPDECEERTRTVRAVNLLGRY